MYKALYVLVGKEPIYEERSWFQLLLYWMLSKKYWSACWIYTHAPHSQASAGEKAVNKAGLGDKLGRVMAAEGAGSLWYSVTLVSSLPSFLVQSGAASGTPFPLPKMLRSWMFFLHLRFCPAVFSLFEGVSSQWTHCTCPSFLLNFLPCVCVQVKDALSSFPFIISYLLLLPLWISNTQKGEGKWNCTWGTNLLCYMCENEGYFIPVSSFNFHLLIPQQWILLWLLQSGLVGASWEFPGADCEWGGESPSPQCYFYRASFSPLVICPWINLDMCMHLDCVSPTPPTLQLLQLSSSVPQPPSCSLHPYWTVVGASWRFTSL